MYINELIKADLFTVDSTATLTELKQAAEKTDHLFLAIVEPTGELIGTVCKRELNEANEFDFSLDDILNKHFVYDYYHILETIREFLKVELPELPVVDEEGFYLGVCHLNEVQYHFNRQIGLIEGGSLIIIRAQLQHYSMVDVAKIVESNQARVLNFYLTSHPDANNIEITLILNTADISDIISTFNRFDYEVVYSSTASERDDFLKERYDSFMHFLDI